MVCGVELDVGELTSDSLIGTVGAIFSLLSADKSDGDRMFMGRDIGISITGDKPRESRISLIYKLKPIRRANTNIR